MKAHLLTIAIMLFGSACTSRTVPAGDPPAKKPAVTTTEPKVTKGDRWTSGDRRPAKKPATVASKKSETRWEKKGSGVGPSADAEGHADAGIAAAPPAVADSISGESSRAKSAMGAGAPLGRSESRARGKKSPLAGRSMSEMDRRSYTHRFPQPQTSLLTAGSFDDALDINGFERFWRASPLSQRKMPTAHKPPQKRHNALQLAFVVDTTGSMGDELEYLKVEFKSIVSEVSRTYPGVEKQYAVIVYKDDGDEYVTRGIAFSTDANEIQRFIDEQSAGGGGDYPEAVHAAFDDALERLQWDRGNQTAKMLFHIADAPPHDGSDMDMAFERTTALANADIGIYPIASSGIEDVAEAVMRATALMTGGQYLFLTDDSGVGNAHAAPKHPCYHVEKLKNAMVRMVGDRIAGTRTQPARKNIIRTVGNAQAATCLTNTKTWAVK